VEQLDNPVWWAITGPQRELGVISPGATRYHPDIAPLGALGTGTAVSRWDDLAALVGPKGTVVVTGDGGAPPSGWTVIRDIPATQMLGHHLHPPSPTSDGYDTITGGPPPDTLLSLGPDDVPDMLDLVAETKPGPFRPRTVELGGYLGVRRHSRLIAMAGERVRLPGFTEISAVATHPDHRGQGLAKRLIRAVVETIVSRNEVPFLHVSLENITALRLYESMGFTARREVSFLIVETPERL
jgi:ribosomal protein S18 acetylase RimI-like enzyme